MTTPDTKTIRAQMEALREAGQYMLRVVDHLREWHRDDPDDRINLMVKDGCAVSSENMARAVLAAAPDMRETILTLCADVERLRRMLDLRGTGPAERYWEGRWRDEAAENERLRNFIADFSETKFDRIDRRSPDPQDDLDPLTDYLAIEAWQEDARAALGQEGDA